MAAQGTLMEPLTQDASSSGAKLGLISVVIPVVERADDLLSVYHAFAHELEDRLDDPEHDEQRHHDRGHVEHPFAAGLIEHGSWAV